MKKSASQVEFIVKIPMKQHLAAFVVYIENLEHRDEPINVSSSNVIPSYAKLLFYPLHVFQKEKTGNQITAYNRESYIRIKITAEMKRLNQIFITPKNINIFNRFVNNHFLSHVSKLIQAERERAAPLKEEPRSSRKIIEQFLDRLDAYDNAEWESIRRAVDRHTDNHKSEKIAGSRNS